MKKITQTITCILLVLFAGSMKSQMSGIYTVPGSYASIGAAIADLNTQGVNAAVTINVAAGHTETAPVGGYTLNAIVGTSAANQITFQKSGAGANPIITAYAGGTATPASAIQDGIWKFNGTDYVTVDGINLTDPNAANPATMEYGFGFFKASATDGCQNNTIKNCVVTLNRVNNAAGSGPSIEGSRAINVVNALMITNATAVTVTSAAGSNSYNKFYSNTLQNCNVGISMIGFADVTPFAFADTDNDFGGSSVSTGNSVLNFGGGGTTQSQAVSTLAQYNLNVSYNVINNNNGSGVSHGGQLKGIFVNTAVSANVSINNNTITVINAGTTGGPQLRAIDNSAGGTAANNAVNINNNLLLNCTYGTSTSGSFDAIINNTAASSATLSISNNTCVNTTISGSGTSFGFMHNSGAATRIDINNNVLDGFKFAVTTSSDFNFLYMNGANASGTLNIIGNTVRNMTTSVAVSGVHTFILNNKPTLEANINNNIFENLNLTTTGNVLFFNNNSAVYANGAVQNVNNNSILGSFTKAAGGTVTFYTNTSSSVAGATLNTIGNNFSNVSLSGATTLAGWVTTGTSGPTKNITANTFTNIIGGTSGLTILSSNGNGNNTTISSNTISGVTGGGAITGITMGTSGASTLTTVSSNIISAFTSTGGAVVGIVGAGVASPLNVSNNLVTALTTSAALATGISITATGVNNVFKNKIYDIQSNGTGGTVSGLTASAGNASNIFNNLIGDLRTPAAQANNALIGMNISGGTAMNVSYNSVHINGTSTGTVFGSSALLVATGANVTLNNNIFVNNSVPTGTGITVAYRRSSTTLASYQAASNNNLFYAGTPGASNVIFYDGTTAYQTLAAFKALVGPSRDFLTVTENPSFISISGSNANFLNINTSTPTQIEGGAASITGITDDYTGNTRNATTPDLGAWEGTYVSLDLTAPVLLSSGFTTPVCNLAGRTFTASFVDLSGIASGALAPRVYYKLNAGAYSSAQGTLTSGTAFNGVWTFNLAYSASLSDVVSYYVVVQDNAGTPNLLASPSAGFAGSDVNTVTTAPTTPFTYVVNALNGVYTVGSAGTFTSLTAAANAYNTYCLNGPVTFSLTDALYSTAETFPIVFRNNAQASSTNSLLIRPATGVAVAVTQTNTAITSVIKFLDARYITIDGMNAAGSTLNINNASTAASADIWLASSNTTGVVNNFTGPGNNFIAVKNTTIKAASNASGLNGIMASVDGSAPSATGGSDNDNITISTNSFIAVYSGVTAYGTATVSAGGLDNWVVSNNVFGPVASTTGSNIAGNAILINNGLGFSVSSNNIRNAAAISPGCMVLTSSSNFSVVNNTVQNFTLTTTLTGAICITTATNFIVNGNTIQNGTSSSTGGGLFISGANTFTAGLNTITNFTATSSTSGCYAMNLNANNTAFTVSQNTINNIYSTAGSSGVNSIAGLFMGSNHTNGAVTSNSINTIINTNTSGYGVKGIILNNVGATSNITIANNFISDIYCFVDQSVIYWPAGILIDGTSGSINIDHNTINLFGSHGGRATASAGTGAAPIIVVAASGNINVRNNILSNTYDNSTQTTDVIYAVYSAAAATNFVNMDYNNYYVGGVVTNKHVGYVGGAARTTLYDVQVNFGIGKNIHSVNFQPQFISSTDLHLDATAITNAGMDNTALPIGIVNDIDGQVRSATTPDMGADEFTATGTCTSAVGGTLSVTTATLCTTQTVLATPNGVSTGVGTTYQWKVGSTPGTYTNLATGTNTIPTIFSDLSTYPSGTYYVVLQTSCSNGGLTGISNEATITVVNPAATPTITSTSNLVCQGGSATLTASGAASYVWSPGGATTSTLNITPTANTVYSVTTTNGVCSSVGTINILYSPNPTVTIVNTSPTVCANVAATLTASGADTYTWSTGDNTAVINPIQSSATIYTVVGTNTAGCLSASVTTTVTAKQIPTITVSGSSGICTGQTASLTASGAITYTWDNGSNNPSIVDSPVTTTTYTVTGTNALGCSVATTQVVNVAASLNIAINGSGGGCINQPLLLTATGGVTYTWSTSETTSTIAPTFTGTTTYSVIGASGTCSNSAVTTITVNPDPVIAITGNSIICAGQTTTLTASGAATYSWNTGATTATAAVSPATNTVYSGVGTSSLGCPTTFTAAVTSNSLPVITVSFSSPTVCVNTSATLTASGANTYTWVAGPQTASAIVTPTANTVYTVSGTANGCTAVKQATLSTFGSPTITIAPATPTICASTTLNLTASGANTYTWTGGPSTSTYVVSPAITTTYTVTGTSTANCVSNKTVAVVTNTLPALVVAAPETVTLCSLSTATFSASGATSYTWSTSPAATTSIISVAPAVSTVYTVTGKNAANCISTATAAVVSLTLPALTIAPSNSVVCPFVPITYTASGADTYTWTDSPSTSSTAVFTTTNPTAYTVTATGVNGCTITAQTSINIYQLPTVYVTGSALSICALSPITYTAEGADTYTWSTSNTGSVMTSSPAGPFTYTVTGTNTITGCIDTETASAVVNPLPSVSVTPASTVVCRFNSVALTASGANLYQWISNNNSPNVTINVTPSVTTTYSVKGMDALTGCANTASAVITVNQLPVIAVTPGPTTICVNGSASFTASGASSYVWTPGNVTTAVMDVTPSASTAYTVTGTDANNCTAKAYVGVEVSDCVGIKTNAFSGNAVSVYPNPSNGVITAKFDFEGSKTVTITNAVGQLITQATTANTSETFDLSGLSKGVYFVKVSTKDAAGNYKIIIE